MYDGSIILGGIILLLIVLAIASSIEEGNKEERKYRYKLAMEHLLAKASCHFKSGEWEEYEKARDEYDLVFDMYYREFLKEN